MLQRGSALLPALRPLTLSHRSLMASKYATQGPMAHHSAHYGSIVTHHPQKQGHTQHIAHIPNPIAHYDTALSKPVRKYLGTYGLIPPVPETYETQKRRCLAQLALKTTNIEKFQYLATLRHNNVHLFYRLLTDHFTELTPLVYTPVVGEACQRWSEIYQQPEGMYLSFDDKGHIASVLHNWPQEHVEITVITDGSRILGLGDLGINGMGIPIGKLALYTGCAGIRPEGTLPLTVDLGTSNQSLRDDPLYLGSKRDKVSPQEEQARKSFWLVDSKGLVTLDRGDQLAEHKFYFARDDNAGQQFQSLEQVMDHVKPTILMGLSTIGGAFTPELLQKMGKWNNRPIIFPLSNPISKSECTFEEAIVNTDGRALFASGSPFYPYEYNGKLYHPGQGNNMYVFPGIGLGAILCKAVKITPAMIYASGEAVPTMISDEEKQLALLYPKITRIRDVSVRVALYVIRMAQKEKVDRVHHLREMSDDKLELWIKERMYDPHKELESLEEELEELAVDLAQTRGIQGKL